MAHETIANPMRRHQPKPKTWDADQMSNCHRNSRNGKRVLSDIMVLVADEGVGIFHHDGNDPISREDVARAIELYNLCTIQ